MTCRRASLRVALGGVAALAVVLAGYRAGRDSAELPTIVWVTARGEVYHRATCRYLRGGGVRVTLAEAKGRYRPCRVCGPPR